LSLIAWITGLAGNLEDTERASRTARAVIIEAGDPWLEGIAGLGRAYCATMCARHADALQILQDVSANFARASDRHMRMFACAQRALQFHLLNQQHESGRELVALYALTKVLENLRGATSVC